MVRRSLSVIAALSLFAVWPAAADDSGAHVRIETPRAGSVVTTSSIVVSGTAFAPSPDIGITVDGFAATIDVDHAGTNQDPFHWFAEVKNAASGSVKIQAVLHQPGDTRSEDQGDDEGDNGPVSTRVIPYAPADPSFIIIAAPQSGLSPLNTFFTVMSHLDTSGAHVELDLDGSGQFAFSSTGLPDPVPYSYATPGVRLVTARMTTSDGKTYTAATAICAESFHAADAVIRQVWSRFRTALEQKDVTGAMAWLAADDTRAKYGPALTAIRGALPSLAVDLNTLDAISINDRTAHYLLRRTEAGTVKGYHVYFAKDVNGLWKIVQF